MCYLERAEGAMLVKIKIPVVSRLFHLALAFISIDRLFIFQRQFPFLLRQCISIKWLDASYTW